jgi:arylsulfatase A-like enzyme
MLRRHGYATAQIGKLHFLPHANRDHRAPHPSYGFDHIEVSDEPGVYDDAYRAWVSKAPSRGAYAHRPSRAPPGFRAVVRGDGDR